VNEVKGGRVGRRGGEDDDDDDEGKKATDN
jgi:hypothetical protein